MFITDVRTAAAAAAAAGGDDGDGTVHVYLE